MDDNEVMPRAVNDQQLSEMCSLLNMLQKKGGGFAPGMMSFDGFPIVVMYKKFTDRDTPFCFTEHSRNFKILVIREDIPENVRNFIAEREMFLMTKNVAERSLVKATWHAIKKCPNGFRTFLNYLFL